MERWQGKVAVVTGAASGIGQAVATRLAQSGLIVVGIDINLPSGESKINYFKCDITDREKLADLFKLIEEKFGGVAILVNCAGIAIFGHFTSVGPNQLSEEAIARVYDVNIKATVMCARHAVDSMKRHNFHGHIVNINSIAGHYVPFNHEYNAYSSSKYAVTAFTQALAVELAAHKSNIKTTSISPGLVKTPLSESKIKDFSTISYILPDDVAEAVLYAISTPPHVNISEMTVQPVGERRM